MHTHSKVAIGSIVINTIVFIVFVIKMAGSIEQASGDFTHLVRLWGVFFALQIAIVIALNVMVTVIVQTIEKASGSRGFEEPTDERDRLIEGVASKRFGVIFALGFLAAMTALAFNLHLSLGMWIIAGAMLLGQLVMNITSIVGYERGI